MSITLGAITGELASNSGEVGVGGDQDPLIASGGGHDGVVRMAAESQLVDVYAVVAHSPKQFRQPSRQALVEQQPHAVIRTGNSRWSTAWAA